MLTVTATALERLSEKLAGTEVGDDVALRFRRTEGRWRLGVDRARPDDATFTHNGRKVLLLGRAAARAMDAWTLIVRDTAAGPRLKLRRSAKAED